MSNWPDYFDNMLFIIPWLILFVYLHGFATLLAMYSASDVMRPWFRQAFFRALFWPRDAWKVLREHVD